MFVSELDVECNVIVDGKELLSTPLKFHVEFSPEDYENEKDLSLVLPCVY